MRPIDTAAEAQPIPPRSDSRLADLDDPVAQGENQRLQLRVDAELAEDVGDVVALSADTDVQPAGDRLVAEPFGHGLQDLALPRRERLERGAVLVLLLAPVTGEPQQGHRLIQGQQCLPGLQPAYGVDYLAELSRLV